MKLLGYYLSVILGNPIAELFTVSFYEDNYIQISLSILCIKKEFAFALQTPFLNG